MSTAIDTKTHPTVKALAEHQKKLGLSGKIFARRYLRYSDAVWSTLQSGTYKGDVAKVLEACEAALRLIEDEAASAPSSDGLLQLSAQRSALAAVRRCYSEERDRLVAFLADTGGGKTCLGDLLRTVLGETVIVIEATETWRDNYFAALSAILDALGISGEQITTARQAETAILDHLSISPRVLVIDEAHSCGRAVLNLFKHILNIRSVKNRVVMLSMPQLWDRMQERSWQECRQLINRTYLCLRADQIGLDDTRLFLGARLSGYSTLGDEDADQIAKLARGAANRFGLLNTLKRVCKEASPGVETGGLTVEAITNAISRVEALRG